MANQSEMPEPDAKHTVVSADDLRLLQGYVTRLAHFLASPESLQQEIRDRYSEAGTLPKQWQTVLELMPKGPMLKVAGESGEWLVGYHSAAPWAPHVEARPEDETKQAEAIPAIGPTVPSSSQIGASEGSENRPAESVLAEATSAEITSVDRSQEKTQEALSKDLEPTALVEAIQSGVAESVIDQSEVQRETPAAAGKPVESSIQGEPETKRVTRGDAPKRRPSAESTHIRLALEAVRTIEAIDQKIRALTEERVNLDRMALELRLLDISPPFEAFQSSARSLQDRERKNMPGIPDPIHLQIVGQYQDNLRRGWSGMLKTLYLAALLAFDPDEASNSRALTSTLRFLSSELDFASLSTEQINSLLNDLAARARSLGVAESSMNVMFYNLSAMTMSAENIDKALANAKFLAKGLTNLKYTFRVMECYQNRARNLILHMRSGNRLPPMDLIELRLLYVGAVTRFTGDPNKLSLSDYANALRAASTVDAKGFMMTVFLKLGFVRYVREALLDANVRNMIHPDLLQDIEEQAELSKEPPQRVLIVTREPLNRYPIPDLAVVSLDPQMVLNGMAPPVDVCMTGSDIDGNTTISLRSFLRGTKVIPLEVDTGRTLTGAVQRALANQPDPKSPPTAS